MINTFRCYLTCTALASWLPFAAFAQTQPKSDEAYYQSVQTYVNPVLPGDHPDPTLLKVGDDFYHCGSTFHFNPYLPIYHSKDLIHWEIISRVLPASKAGWVSDKPSAGIWQGAITYFYGSYWIYFSAGGQWFCKAPSPKGPWSAPVQVKSNPQTGPLGYDNSIFVDDDGKPYMVIKNGQKVNRLQALGKNGQLTDTVINLDWINAKLQYSWAEGPVMCKRNGYYYYFPAGDVSGGQYVLRASKLTSDSTKWERLGEFFKPISDSEVGFRRPNHIAAPVQLADGTWWTIGQSYEKYQGNDWSGTGRQTGLYQVVWEGDRPWGMAPTTQPVVKPNLPKSGIPWRRVASDDFDKETLDVNWHFLTKRASSQYLLTKRKGWITLMPDTNRAHLMQKETDHYYTVITKVDLNATDSADKAGIYLTNGNQKVIVRLFSGFDQGKKITLQMDTATRVVSNPVGNTVWLKLRRYEHWLTGYYSLDGKSWTVVGAAVNAVDLDKAQPNFNSWVGTSVGLFAESKPADFDCFTYKDGFSEIPAISMNNFYGVKRLADKSVTNTSSLGGWLMLAGVDFGQQPAENISIQATSSENAELEIWIDDLKDGKRVAKMPVTKTATDEWKTFTTALKKVKGQHDVFIKFAKGASGAVKIKSMKLVAE
ncbi:family 43 glycosylhydrolase [Mucilaginibacter lacusdianchii]|uniref:family 43 glycosylhydrolase n=1 Tax=Mucilaginibacter lacusdianchii TaxID=2684211 RepID=UPI00131BBE77|nr:family 43 glycosylhydrolase [Mucilaginibacter sp. JXJ CY 39]